MNAKISVFVTCVKAIIYFLLYNLHGCTFKHKNIKICVLKNSCLNRLFNLVYFKVALLGYSRPNSSEVTDFIPVFAAMLN